jgi:hypothetical protein
VFAPEVELGVLEERRRQALVLKALAVGAMRF